MACVAVHPDYRSSSRGEMLLQRVENQARQMGLKKLFVLTTRSIHWFRAWLYPGGGRRAADAETGVVQLPTPLQNSAGGSVIPAGAAVAAPSALIPPPAAVQPIRCGAGSACEWPAAAPPPQRTAKAAYARE
ncbi:GNAT family N-acetyltransferase [Serratia ureilytica]